MREHTETHEGITYTVTIEPEDTPVRGNVLASGDDKADAQAERAVNMHLAAGNQWAWCVVCVTAEIDGFTARNYLGCCSYESVAEFLTDGYYEQMCDEARGELIAQLGKARQTLHKLEIGEAR